MLFSLFLAIKIECPLFTSYWQSVMHALTKERRGKQNYVMVIILIVFLSNYTWSFLSFFILFPVFFSAQTNNSKTSHNMATPFKLQKKIRFSLLNSFTLIQEESK